MLYYVDCIGVGWPISFPSSLKQRHTKHNSSTRLEKPWKSKKLMVGNGWRLVDDFLQGVILVLNFMLAFRSVGAC